MLSQSPLEKVLKLDHDQLIDQPKSMEGHRLLIGLMQLRCEGVKTELQRLHDILERQRSPINQVLSLKDEL